MKGTTKLATALFWLALTGFCLFGFLASFEPGPNRLAFRIGYAVVGVACFVGALWPFIARKNS